MNLPSLFHSKHALSNPLMAEFENDIEQFFDRFEEDPALPLVSYTPFYSPEYDIEDTEDYYVVSMDIPGVNRDDINVQYRPGFLSVSGRRKGNGDRFEQNFNIPEETDPEKFVTDYTNGVLRIAIPKAEAAKARHIKVGESQAGFFDRLSKQERKAVEMKGAGKAA